MSERSKPGLLIFNDYFYPAYKAGGPIQSLTNLIPVLQHEYEVSVVTSNHDLNENEPLANIKTDTWSKQLLPGSTTPINIFYAGNGKPAISIIKKTISEFKPSVIYLNGMFSYGFVIIPLLAIKNLKIVVCPRGMLQQGALAGKSFKKKIYLSLLKTSGLTKKVSWHATNEEEEEDIRRQFGAHSRIVVAGNIPKKPLSGITYIPKQPGQLRLVYLSLISEKKNLLQLLTIVSRLNENISLDIYGPVKDKMYWAKCQEIIKLFPAKFFYKGDVLPQYVQDVFTQYHASILLTKGENFGHALYESLSAGRPLITSYFTPWNKLTAKKAGWNTDISNEDEIVAFIKDACSLDQQVYNEYCNGAHALANEYYKSNFDISSYKTLFS